MRLLRRGLAATFVGLVLVLSVLAGPAGAAPTGTLPRHKPVTESTTDKVITIGLTAASFTPWGRVAVGARWLFGAASAHAAGESLWTYFNGAGEAGDTGTDDYPGSLAGPNPNRLGQPTSSPNTSRCYNHPQTSTGSQYDTPTTRSPAGNTVGVRFNITYEPNAQVLATFGTDAVNTCRDDPDGSGGPMPIAPYARVNAVYYCTDAAGAVVMNPANATAHPGQPTANSFAGKIYDHSAGNGIGTGSGCPAGGAVAFLRYWAVQAGGDHMPGVGTWVRPGFDPDRLYTRTVQVDCINLATGVVNTLTAGYTADPGDSPDAKANVPTCPAGTVPQEIRTYESLPGFDSETLISRDTVDYPKISQDYPDCYGVGCELEVYADGKKCTVGKDDCWNWWETSKTAPDRFGCKWGPYTVPLDQCKQQEHIYRTGETGTDPDTGERVAAVPSTGHPDPDAGPIVGTDPVPDDRPAPAPNPSAPPGAGTDPNSPNPAPDPDGDGGNCWAAAISWNPVDWVMVPVQCALTWAFVPGPGAMADTMTDVGGAFGDTGVGKWFGAAGDLVSSTSGGGPGSCAGPEWAFSTAVTGPISLHPFWACGPPQSVVSSVVKIGLTVMVWLGAGIVCLRLIGASMGLNLNGVGGRDADT